MNNIRKYVLNPFESDNQSSNIMNSNQDSINSTTSKNVTNSNKNFIKEQARLRIENILKIITNISLVKGFDQQRRIKNQNGKYVLNTDIIDLILHAMQPGKLLHGEEEFINLLREANVNPNWIFNENIKAKLKPTFNEVLDIDKNNESIVDENFTNTPQMLIKYNEQPLKDEKVKISKRKRSEEIDNNIEEQINRSKKRKIENWDYSDDE